MTSYDVASAEVLGTRGYRFLRALAVSSIVAVLLFCSILPLCANAEDDNTALSPSVEAARCHNECCFAPTVELSGEILSLRGLSTYRYWGFRVYTGALYAPRVAQSREAVRGEVKKKIVLCYHRSLSPEQFREKSQEVLEDSPGLDLNTLEPHLSAINKAYVEVKEGDRYAITYAPSSGTMKLLLNDREPGLVAINSASFAKAYFGIWLSEYSVGKDFTAALFGEQEAEE
jgi:hypothetical protein